MKQIHYTQAAARLDEGLKKGGVFLTVKDADKVNTMTIGWAFFGTSWRKDCFVAMVRASRHTHGMLDHSGVFTVSVPASGELRKELALCGSKSGRNVDKFAEAGLTAQAGQALDCPVVGECALHLECRVVHAQDMTPERLDGAIRSAAYAEGDYHTLYFGEIVACYEA